MAYIYPNFVVCNGLEDVFEQGFINFKNFRVSTKSFVDKFNLIIYSRVIICIYIPRYMKIDSMSFR